MAQFLDLPIELLPHIFSYVLKPNWLSNVCLVNKIFYDAAIPRLYYKVTVFSWHKDVKTRVVQLFATLANCPRLARLVHHLEIRDFAKNLIFSADERAKLVFVDVLRGLKNCINLRWCTWTRDGSLTSEILEALLCGGSSSFEGQPEPELLTARPLVNCKLRALEINGHDEGLYDRNLLLGFVGLERISLIMPTASVASLLPSWTLLNHAKLRSLTLICKASAVVTDELMVSLGPTLDHLEEFHLAGCARVTHQGILAVLAGNIRGIVELRLEGLAPRFDMSEFSRRSTATGAMKRLRSITLTVRQQSQPLSSWFDDVLVLLAPAPLEVFQIYSLNTSANTPATDNFCRAIVSAHGDRLVRFAVHRTWIGLDVIADICERCVKLEELYIVVPPTQLSSLGPALACGNKLRNVHVNYPLEAVANAGTIFIPSDIVSIVDQCSPTLVQFGCNTRVWRVTNDVQVAEDGSLTVSRVLSPYDSPDIPEAFLVVRT